MALELKKTQNIQHNFCKILKAEINNIIGVTDGSYIPIPTSKKPPHANLRRKNVCSITLQAFCDDKLRTIDVSDMYRWYPGSVGNWKNIN